MSGDVVQRARAALDGTTPGPWEFWAHGSITEGIDGEVIAELEPGSSRRDGQFIATAPGLVRELVVELERVTAERDRLAAAIRIHRRQWTEFTEALGNTIEQTDPPSIDRALWTSLGDGPEVPRG